MIKFRNYGIEAYAIFQGGDDPYNAMHKMHWKKRDDLSNCALKYEKEMIYQVSVTVKGSTTLIINDTPKKRDS
jgi:hypothetical protein